MKNAFLFLFLACLSFSGLFAGACTLEAPTDKQPPGGGAGEGDTGSAGVLAKGGGAGSGTGGATPSSASGNPSQGGETSGEAGAGAGGADGAPDCSAEEKSCDGACVDIDNPIYGCGATSCDASACPSESTGGTVVCEGSACVIGSCPANYKKCGGKCVAVSDPTYGCGATTCDATACPAAGSGTLVCQASACVVGTCVAGTKKCGDKCVTIDANNGCADAAKCTPCANNEACTGSPTTCQCVPTPMATACMGKCNTVSNGCGGTYTCGSCTSPQTCGGGGVANVCGCTKIAMGTACSQKSCGTAQDGCNGTYTCGTCSSPSAPICLSNACKQCASVADCPSGSFNCTNNACVCRTPSTQNVIQDGGFDKMSDLSKWTSTGTVWTNSDADGCPGSGSITITAGSIKRCFQIPQVPASGAEYAFGFRYKAGAAGSGCFGGTFQDANCTQNGSLFINVGTNESSIWSSEFFQGSVPEGTSSISVECPNSSFLTIDQMFLRKTGFTGPGF